MCLSVAVIAIAVAVVAVLFPAGCGPDGSPASDAALVYVPKPLAGSVSAPVRPKEWSNPALILAPLRPDDLLAAIRNTGSGDFAVAVTPGPLANALLVEGLAAETKSLRVLRLVLAARRPLAVDRLGETGLRLGTGSPKGALGQAVPRALGDELADAVRANTVHKTESSAALIRLVQQDALDAALVWDIATGTAHDLIITPLTGDEAWSDLVICRLHASRRTPRQAADIVAAMAQRMQAVPGGDAP